MKTIKVTANTHNVRSMYKKARTSAQRALLGYMVKTGVATDPVFCGAFDVLRNIEWCMEGKEVYNLYPIGNPTIVRNIIDIVQSALNEEFDDFSFSAREIDNIIRYMEDF